MPGLCIAAPVSRGEWMYDMLCIRYFLHVSFGFVMSRHAVIQHSTSVHKSLIKRFS
ncbi:MAG: hypothetical protein RIR96_809 [Bacteroidota bacterium]|jgi:hypothetical protein